MTPCRTGTAPRHGASSVKSEFQRRTPQKGGQSGTLLSSIRPYGQQFQRETVRHIAGPGLAEVRGIVEQQAARRIEISAVSSVAEQVDWIQQPHLVTAIDPTGRLPEPAVLLADKRHADVVGIIPDEDSIVRLVSAVLLEQNDEWQLQYRYMQIEGMAELKQPIMIE